jgi:hypothetical protein
MLEPSGAVTKMRIIARSSCGASSAGILSEAKGQPITSSTISTPNAASELPTIHNGLRPSSARRSPAAYLSSRS